MIPSALPAVAVALQLALARPARTKRAANRTRRRTKSTVSPVAADPAPAAPAAPTRDESALSTDRAARIATHVWRARRYLQPALDSPDARRAGREIDATLLELAAAGVVVEDYDGQPHHEGMALEVLAHQEQADLARDTVLSTIRPSVYVGDHCVQQGQVIVGVPTAAHQKDAHA